eukprot:394499_1
MRSLPLCSQTESNSPHTELCNNMKECINMKFLPHYCTNLRHHTKWLNMFITSISKQLNMYCRQQKKHYKYSLPTSYSVLIHINDIIIYIPDLSPHYIIFITL